MLRRLEKYEILSEIGYGGMATVYRARDSRLDREVALKVMHPHLRAAKEARIRFSREAKTVARLKHPNVLEIYDSSGEDSEESFISTELLTGPTLKVFAEQRPEIPPEIAACFGIQIARALAAAHAAGIIHRDVKPENVLIHENRVVKLTDFGIAQMIDAATFTATGQILGSPGHMAPEQIEGQECDARADVFSLGTVLYFLATGVLPFIGKNPHQVLKRIVEGDYVDPVRVRPAIGGRFGAIIRKALSRVPADRYPSASDFEAALVHFVAEVGITDPDAVLATYLSNPDAFVKEFNTELVGKLAALAEEAGGRTDVEAAYDYCNRVLALDENNARVMQLLPKLRGITSQNPAARKPKKKAFFSLILLFFVGSASLLAWALHDSHDSLRPVDEERHDAGTVASPPLPSTARLAATDAGSLFGGQALVSQTSDAAARADAARLEVHSSSNRIDLENKRRLGIESRRNPLQTFGAERSVLFDFFPRNVTLSIDGSEPRAVGPSFPGTTLRVGTHRFKLEGSNNCCEAEEWTGTIEPGSDSQRLTRRLTFKPARLYIVTNVPASVEVGEGLVTGRSRALLSIPMTQFTAPLQIVVTAPGHERHTSVVRLQAGSLTDPPPIFLVPVASP